MQRRVLEIFTEITRISRCSGETSEMQAYLLRFAEKCGYRAESDEAGNVMAYGKRAGVTLQSHYDMVCIGKAPEIETVVEDGWMRAEESSLGADNGMGVAMMLALMERNAAADFLFTNDEEIGLIGASKLALKIRTPYLLNLDSEELGKIYIGCAGGEDIYAGMPLERVPVSGGRWWRLRASAPGGHSGVNIADGIPNAITELCAAIAAEPTVKIASIEGGERINAIPRHAEALVSLPESATPLSGNSRVVFQEAEPPEGGRVCKGGRRIVEGLFGFAHGVRAWNRELGLPESSINLAQVKMEEGRLTVACSGRAMSNEELARLSDQTVAGWEALGYRCEREGKYPAWKPQKGPFAKKVLILYRRYLPEASYAAIHAGLECAIFAEKFPRLQIASIGPTILDPHSDRERVDLASVETVMRVVEDLIADLSPV
ncbi:M28 family peptidase [Hydrogenimonas sp. SS33]|uniref:M28 family peptidase n=1 Tax=Hydrogenimonas leucolamina TaxID=2954236 RepID=UPI00336BF2A9